MEFTITKTVVDAPVRKLKGRWMLSQVDSGYMLELKDFNVLEKANINGLGRNDCWSVEVSDEIREWLSQNYSYGTDYEEVNSIKGVWVNMTEAVLIMLKLKWS